MKSLINTLYYPLVAGRSGPAQAIEIDLTRGNADLLRKIAARATALETGRRNFGARLLNAEDFAAGSLSINKGRGTFRLHRVEFDCTYGRAPHVTLEARTGLIRLHNERNWHALCEPSSIPADADKGEVVCPECGFVNTRVGLAEPPCMSCADCGLPASKVLAGERAERAAA